MEGGEEEKSYILRDKFDYEYSPASIFAFETKILSYTSSIP